MEMDPSHRNTPGWRKIKWVYLPKWNGILTLKLMRFWSEGWGNFLISNCSVIEIGALFPFICLKYSFFREYFVFSFFSYTDIKPIGMSECRMFAYPHYYLELHLWLIFNKKQRCKVKRSLSACDSSGSGRLPPFLSLGGRAAFTGLYWVAFVLLILSFWKAGERFFCREGLERHCDKVCSSFLGSCHMPTCVGIFMVCFM